MKVFLSWSGHKSHQVALALRDWLPSVIQSVTPYVSSEDIDKGARWSTDIAKELEDSSFGILCVTKDNLEAPWLLFEAGALSKMMEKGAVCPFLFDLKMAEIKEGPILQFQTTVYEKDDIKKLLISLNKSCGDTGLKEELLLKSFDVWWPSLDEALKQIMSEKDDGKTQAKKTTKDDMLEEILELTRINQKILRSPETILPPEYIEHLIRTRDRMTAPRERKYLEEINMLLMEIRHLSVRTRDMLEYYKTENHPIDEDFYMANIRLFDYIQRMQMLIDKWIHMITK